MEKWQNLSESDMEKRVPEYFQHFPPRMIGLDDILLLDFFLLDAVTCDDLD